MLNTNLEANHILPEGRGDGRFLFLCPLIITFLLLLLAVEFLLDELLVSLNLHDGANLFLQILEEDEEYGSWVSDLVQVTLTL